MPETIGSIKNSIELAKKNLKIKWHGEIAKKKDAKAAGELLKEYIKSVTNDLEKLEKSVSEFDYQSFVSSNVSYDFAVLYNGVSINASSLPQDTLEYLDGTEFKGKVSFAFVHFLGRQNLKNCTFHYDVYFTSSEFTAVHFLNCRFLEDVSFKRTVFETILEFRECLFEKVPSFDGAEIKTRSLLFTHCKFNDFSSITAENNYRLVKLLATEKGQEYLAEDFAVYEAKARRINLRRGWWQKLTWPTWPDGWPKDFWKKRLWQQKGWLKKAIEEEVWKQPGWRPTMTSPITKRTLRLLGAEYTFSWLYNWSSGYGASLFKPFVWIALLTSLYAVNLNMNETVIVHYDKEEPPIEWVEDLEEAGDPYLAASYAIKAASGPLRFFTDSHLTVTSWSDRMWGDILSVVSTILWFLGIMSIRRRFRIKNPD